jgi:hypothetical protein
MEVGCRAGVTFKGARQIGAILMKLGRAPIRQLVIWLIKSARVSSLCYCRSGLCLQARPPILQPRARE